MSYTSSGSAPNSRHQDQRLEWFLLILLLLRFSLIYEPLNHIHPRIHVFWVYVILTYIFTYFTIKHIKYNRSDYHLDIPSKKDVWVWGFGLGLVAAAVNIFICCYFHNRSLNFSDVWYFHIFALPIVQFCVAATVEEPLFRGLLWGYLKRLGRPDWAILIIQALLFFAGHVYYATPGMYSNWFSTLLMGFMFGISAWKTRSILPSMVAHALVNGLSQTFL